MSITRNAAVLVFCLFSAACADSVMGPTTVLPTNPETEFKQKLPDVEPASDVVETPSEPPVGSGVPSGAGSTSAHALCKDIQQGVSCLVLAYSQAGATVKFTNSSAVPQMVAFESFSLGVPDTFDNQTVYDAKEMELPAGQSVTWSIAFPMCYQVDAHIGYKVNHPPHVPHTLLGFEKDVSRGCDKPQTDCRAITDRRFAYFGDFAVATFKVPEGYEITLWFAGYQRLNGSWDSQRFLGGVPPKVYGPGVHSVTVPAALTWSQSDGWCGGEDLYGQDVTPANIARFNDLNRFFPYYVLSNRPGEM